MSEENEIREFDKAISRWKIQFDTGGDPVEFLERLEELADTLNVNKDKVLHLVPRCLRGRASLWYRNNSQSWTAWEDFINSFKLYYYPRNYEKNLSERIINRKQGYKEKFINYLTDIQTLMRRYGKLNQEEQLERIYDNIKPSYQFYIKRKDFNSVGELIKLAGDYEKINMDRYKETQRTSENKYREHQTERRSSGEQRTEKKLVCADYDKRTSCWKCGKRNHSANECRGKQVIFCNQCGTLGKLTKKLLYTNTR